MKESNELTERMDGVDELIDSLVKKVTELDKRELKYPDIPDYMPHFESLETAISQLNVSYPAEQIQNTIAEARRILEAIQKALPVKVKHQFDFKTKGWIIAGMVLLIVTAISTGLSGHLWIENNRLHAVDIKYRLLRQVDSISTKWADSVYSKNPDEAGKTVIKMERDQIRLTKMNKSAKK